MQIYLNEIPTNAQTVFTTQYDIQQIEVLRGPQGLLRGLSAPAGSITITTRRPNFDQVEGYAQATGTDQGGYNVQGGVSLPFSDKFAIRVAGLVDGNRINDVRDVNLNNERSQSRTESVRVTLGWRPTDNFTAYLTYQYLNADNRQFQQVIGTGNYPYNQYYEAFGTPSPFFPAAAQIPDTTHPSGPNLTPSNYGAVADGLFRNINNTNIVNLNTEYFLGGSAITFVGAYQNSKLNITRDLDVDNVLPGYLQYSNVITPYKVVTGELRWASVNRGDGFGWGVGAFYTKQTGITTVTQDSSQFWYGGIAPGAQVNLPYAAIGVNAPGFTPFTLSNTLPISVLVTVPVNAQTWSFNGNLRYKTGPLTIEGGVRYSILNAVQTTQETLSGFVNKPSFEVIPVGLQHNLHHPITGGATIDYALGRDLNAYFAYGHSYRSGSTGVSVPAGISNDLIQTKPEKSDSFEVGFKGSALDRRIGFSVAAYYQKLDNYLSLFPNIDYDCPQTNGACANGGTFTPGKVNGSFQFNYNGNATIKGIEGSIDGRITHDWDISLNAAYSHGRYDKALLPCNDFAHTGSPNQNGSPSINGNGNVSYCASNGRLADVPDFSLTGNTEIRFPMGDYTPYVRGLLSYRPGFFSDRVQYHYSDVENVNVYVGIRSKDDKWDVDVFAKNVLNQHRITNIAFPNTVSGLITGTFASNYQQVNVTNPREIGATLAFKW